MAKKARENSQKLAIFSKIKLMRRLVERDLKLWKDRKDRMPLLVRGARQVGKSYIIETFGKENFDAVALVNFEARPEFCTLFENQLLPEDIIPKLERLLNLPIIPGKTLLFFDEIQNCPRAIMSLRYFKEKMPELHVIGAGSLLEFAIEEESFSFPVGRIEFLYMEPLSLKEFFLVQEQTKLIEAIDSATLRNPLDEVTHQWIIEQAKSYFLVGGMPQAVASFVREKSYIQCQRIQDAILLTYKGDFGKYAKKAQYKYLQLLFDRAPRIIGENFKYSKIEQNVRSRDLKTALEQLCLAGLIHQVHATSASGIPLQSEIKENKFKIIFLDIGLLQGSWEIDPIAFFQKDFFQINQGMLAEQFVGQELLAYGDKHKKRALYFWEREHASNAAQVDFLITHSSSVIPIEVKSGKGNHLKSLIQFMKEKKSPIGVKISQAPLSFKPPILYLPFYMVEHLPRLVLEAFLF